jgi:hypothetical protein
MIFGITKYDNPDSGFHTSFGSKAAVRLQQSVISQTSRGSLLKADG